MKLIRQIILGLVLAATFISLSILSVIEYPSDNINLNTKEDKIPVASLALNKLSYLLAYLEKMPGLRLLPAAQVGVNYQTEETVDVYDKITNIKTDLPSVAVNMASSSTENRSLSEVFKRLKDSLSKDWFRP